MPLVKHDFRQREKPHRESIAKRIIELLLRDPFPVIDGSFH